MEFSGKISFIGEVEKVGQNETPKRVVVLEEVGKEYPSSVAVDLRKDKTKLLDSLTVGDTITVSMNFKAREYNGKYFNSISCWKISKDGLPDNGDEKDNLPF